MSKTQVDALYRDQRDLERQLGENVNNESVTKQLTKRLDYVKACLKKAEKDCETGKESAKSAQAVVDFVFEKVETVEHTKKNGSSTTNVFEVATVPMEPPVGAVDESVEEVECAV